MNSFMDKLLRQHIRTCRMCKRHDSLAVQEFSPPDPEFEARFKEHIKIVVARLRRAL